MNILPAIDLFDKKAVRLYKGDYNEMTVYSNNPIEIAKDFESQGAKYIHIVDLEGAKDGTTPNLDIVREITENTGLFVEVGGGIRSFDVLEKYFSCGVKRCILGTAAVEDESFLKKSVELYGEKIAVGADVLDGYIRVKGWLEKSQYTMNAFFEKMQSFNVKTVICTDISKDGAMRGTNLEMYKKLSAEYNLDIIASGGVSSIEDVKALSEMNVSGAIIGKAYYIGAIDLREAIEVAK